MPFPSSASIKQMMSSADATKLSPAAAKLTKQDLLELGGRAQPAKTLADFNLTYQDIKTVQDAIHATHGGAITQGVTADSWSLCCCCTPCCCCSCAVAVVQPARPLA